MTNSPVQPMETTPSQNTPPVAAAPGVVSVSTVTTTSVKPAETTDTVPVTPAGSAPAPTQTKKKTFSPQMIFGALALLILVIGAGVGFMLLNRNQELRQQASTGYNCAGGIQDNAISCSGYRQPVRCTATGLQPLAACSDNQKCTVGVGCEALPAQSCAGGIPDQGKSCDTLHSYVVCSNGSFGTSNQCPTVGGVQQICSNGICGGTSNTGACATSAGDGVCRGQALGAHCLVPGTATTGFCSGNAGGACLCQVGTTGPVVSPSPGTGGACVALTGACDDVTNKCCSDGVCQGVGANRRCEAKQDTCNDPNSTNDGVCGGGSGGWLGFKCNNLTSGQCLENSQTFANYQDAYNYASAGGCGQVDEVCFGGYKNRQLCGSFQVIATSCGGSVATPPASPQPSPSPTPGVTPSPQASPSPSPAPVCAYIAASKAEIRVGDDVSFTCGIIPGATKYEFRVQLPDGTISAVNPASTNSNISELFHVSQLGSYKAQCRICVGPTATCQEWETL